LRFVLCLVVLPLLALGQAAAQGGSIILDGLGTDWDSTWQVATDSLDVFLTDSGVQPHEAPTYARSGYDAIGLWAHYQAADDRWYFRLDVDGRGGDSDSQVGTSANLGVGTHGPDGGPLVALPFADGLGLGNSEAYKLGFQFASGGSGVTTELGPGTAILPGVLADTTGEVTGQAIYSTTVPGVVEFGVDRTQLFPDNALREQLWLSAQLGDNNDRVSDDQVTATLVIALDLLVLCPEAPTVFGTEATFPLDYAIPDSAAQGASDVVLTAAVPTGTTFVRASDGGTESDGIITWYLGDLAPGNSGQVTFTLLVETTQLTIQSEISCAEGLRYRAENVCPVQQPQPTVSPTPTPPGQVVPPLVPEPATLTLMLTGLAGLAGYVAWQRRARRS
jgi:hypothetical protein